MGPVNCNLCGADDYVVVFRKGEAQLHQIVKCNQCGLMYANPQESVDCERLAVEDDSSFYRPEEHREYFQKQHVQLPDNLRALRVVNTLIPQKGKLLEIGSFCGIFLDRIRADGWQVQGLDPSRGAAEYARRTYGLEIIDGTLPNLDLPTGSYDAIIMLHVIEHIPDPMETLRELRRLLKPGGVLVVETPRYDSLSFKLLGRRERSMSACNGHIFFFTVPTLSRMVELNGFKVERVELVGRTLTAERLLTNAGIVSRNEQLKRSFARVSQTLRLDRVRLHVNARDMQRIYCR